VEQQNKISDLILESNHQYLIANKPFGVPIQDDLTKDRSFLNIVENYAKTKLDIITRLDRPVGGTVLFSKKKSAASSFRAQQIKGKIVKRYIAIVEGKFEGEEHYVHFINKNSKVKKAFVVDEAKEGYKEVKLKLSVRRVLDNYTVLEVEITNGKFHQIRAQLSHLGFPIKGDVKYGARRKNQDRSIHLFAWTISFKHPVSGKSLLHQSPLPSSDALWQSCSAPADS